MSPFDEYLQKSARIKQEYKVLIESNPDQKDVLQAELKHILDNLLDECEKKEIERSKHL